MLVGDRVSDLLRGLVEGGGVAVGVGTRVLAIGGGEGALELARSPYSSFRAARGLGVVSYTRRRDISV